MQRLDAHAIHRLGIPRLLLMDHAGLALARAVRDLLPASAKRPVLACCGTGYNGGDGLAALRHLHAWGYAVRALIAGRRGRLREEPAVFARILDRLGVPVRDAATAGSVRQAGAWVSGAGAVIDALLGIGAEGPPREPAASLIARINRAGCPVVCADVPSGLDADTGQAPGAVVQGTVTVAFGAVKRGCQRRAARLWTGRVVVDPITMPSALLRGRAR